MIFFYIGFKFSPGRSINDSAKGFLHDEKQHQHHRRSLNGRLTRHVKLRVAHVPGMPGKFSPPQTSKETAS